MTNEEKVLPDRILYQDEYLAVVYKNIGEVCENDAENRSLSLVENLRSSIESVAGKPLPELEAVHRIDQPVSGCVLLALDKKTHASLSARFASGSIRKRYFAIVEKPEAGTLIEAGGGRLEHLIRFDRKHHKATALPNEEVRKPGPDWKRAALEWKLVGEGDRYLFLEVTPETGRTHQIRAQLAAAGMAIKGDLKYGARRSDPLGGIRLHAFAIQFRHPATRETLTVTAPVREPDALWQAFMKAVP
jgi:23S rRNA pseudouridine1911/1915/1917 synthase